MPTPQESHQQVITLKMQLNEQIIKPIKPIKPILTNTKPIINTNPILTTSINITPIINPETQVLSNKISTPINPSPLLTDGLLSVPTSLMSSNSSTYLIIGSLVIGGIFFLKNNYPR